MKLTFYRELEREFVVVVLVWNFPGFVPLE